MAATAGWGLVVETGGRLAGLEQMDQAAARQPTALPLAVFGLSAHPAVGHLTQLDQLQEALAVVQFHPSTTMV